MIRPLRTCLLGAALLALLPLPASPQFTLRGGVDLAKFFGDGVSDVDRKSDLGFGGAFSLFSVGPASVRAEGYYRRKGARSVAEFQQLMLSGEDAEVGIDYVEVPVLLRIGLPAVGGRILPYINGGPAFAWRIDCSIRVSGTGESSESCDAISAANIEDTLRDYEQGLAIGGGFDFLVGSFGAINIDARLTRGLSRLSTVDTDGEVKNDVFSLMLGYTFGGAQARGGLIR